MVGGFYSTRLGTREYHSWGMILGGITIGLRYSTADDYHSPSWEIFRNQPALHQSSESSWNCASLLWKMINSQFPLTSLYLPAYPHEPLANHHEPFLSNWESLPITIWTVIDQYQEWLKLNNQYRPWPTTLNHPQRVLSKHLRNYATHINQNHLLSSPNQSLLTTINRYQYQ